MTRKTIQLSIVILLAIGTLALFFWRLDPNSDSSAATAPERGDEVLSGAVSGGHVSAGNVSVGNGSAGNGSAGNGSDGYALKARSCGDLAGWRSNMRCATLLTPTYSTGLGPQRFQLPVVILPSSSPERRPDPVLYLPGGPGGSPGLDRDSLQFWREWQRYANLNRDLILMDRRGVGASEPALTCDAYDRFSERAIGQALSAEEESQRAATLLQECFRTLEQGGAFRRDQFGTLHNAQDLTALLRRLPYEQFNLVGVSYGTRLALTAAQRPGATSRIRTLTLDSLYPPEQGGLVSWPGVVTESLHRFIDYCSEQPHCAGQEHTPLGTLLHEALAALASRPMRMRVMPWNQDAPVDVLLDDRRLLAAVFSAVYDRSRWPDIARGLRGATERNAEALQPLVTDFISGALDEHFASLVFMAVDCLDHPLGTQEAFAAQLVRYPHFRQYLDTWAHSVCHWLGSAAEPLPSRELPDVPTLILAGEQDPVTPAHWAQQIAKRWPAAQLYRANDIGHSVLWSDACAEAALGTFLDQPEQPWTPQCESSPN